MVRAFRDWLFAEMEETKRKWTARCVEDAAE
jgi:hypothetical protein